MSRVVAAGRALGIEVEPRELAASTRTAAEASAAIGVELVWAAAGTPHANFAADPGRLAAATGGILAPITRPGPP